MITFRTEEEKEGQAEGQGENYGMEMMEQGQGHGDGQWSLDHTGCQGGNEEKANTAVTPASQIFSPQFNNKK